MMPAVYRLPGLLLSQADETSLCKKLPRPSLGFSNLEEKEYDIYSSSAKNIDPRPHLSAMCLSTPLIHWASGDDVSVHGGMKSWSALIKGHMSK